MYIFYKCKTIKKTSKKLSLTSYHIIMNPLEISGVLIKGSNVSLDL